MLLLQVIDIPNSMTVLPELIPYSVEMVRHDGRWPNCWLTWQH